MQESDEAKSRSGWANLKQALGYGLLICFTLLFAAFVCICFSIRSSVKEISVYSSGPIPW